jgi:multidrug efflux pump subunit AcrA (membrane-fusion protein)
MKLLPTIWPPGLAKGIALAVLLTGGAVWLWAHVGHPPLATQGVTADPVKGLLTFSAKARQALDAQTAEVRRGAVEDRVSAPAVVVTHWTQHAFVTTRLVGKVAQVHVLPGRKMAAGQTLAEVESAELESLLLDLLDATNDAALSARNLEAVGDVVARGSVALKTLNESQSRHQQNLNAVEVARRKLLGPGCPTRPWSGCCTTATRKRTRGRSGPSWTTPTAACSRECSARRASACPRRSPDSSSRPRPWFATGPSATWWSKKVRGSTAGDTWW